ncbi:MAG: type II toxin-antitoxin system VapC family toxin [Gammaproteobacteria bacterium]
MILADVNVLVNAFRADASQHELCRQWLHGVVNGGSRFGMSPQVLASMVRVVTHPRVFRQPSQATEALRFGQRLLEAPLCTVVSPRENHWAIFTRLCRESGARGNLVSDAWFAALAMESGCEWVTLDGDYRRFPGLRWQAPG